MVRNRIRSTGVPHDFVVLPPEASTNWLFDENVVINLVAREQILIIDSRDVRRYRHLAGTSTIDFLKYYLLTVLRTLGVVKTLNYRRLYTPTKITRSLQAIQASKLFSEPHQHDSRIIQAYNNYIDFTGRKAHLLQHINNPADLHRFEREIASARMDLELLD